MEQIALLKTVPFIFDYVDYRSYLKDFYNYKKQSSPSFSLAVFANKAGLSTRNYLKRVIDGERPLTAEYIPKFCNGLNLNSKERAYFEALVNFNQSKDPETKKHYFSVLKDSAGSKLSKTMEILENQFEVFTQWYILPIRELVLLKDFKEDSNWIARKMKNRISKKEAQHALDVLQKLGLLVRHRETQKLIQSKAVIRYSQDVVNMVVRDYHKQTLEQTKQTLDADDISTWNVRSLNIAIPKSELPYVHDALNEFINKINLHLSEKVENKNVAETVIQLNAQVIELTKGDLP